MLAMHQGLNERLNESHSIWSISSTTSLMEITVLFDGYWFLQTTRFSRYY